MDLERLTATVVLDGMRIRAILTPVGAELHTNPTVHMLPPGSVEEAGPGARRTPHTPSPFTPTVPIPLLAHKP